MKAVKNYVGYDVIITQQDIIKKFGYDGYSWNDSEVLDNGDIKFSFGEDVDISVDPETFKEIKRK